MHLHFVGAEYGYIDICTQVLHSGAMGTNPQMYLRSLLASTIGQPEIIDLFDAILPAALIVADLMVFNLYADPI